MKRQTQAKNKQKNRNIIINTNKKWQQQYLGKFDSNFIEEKCENLIIINFLESC